MDNIETDPVDFKVPQFRDYLTEQTQHVNMITGSVSVEQETGESFQPDTTKSEQNSPGPSSAEEGLSGEGEEKEGSETQTEEGSEIRKDCWEKTLDGNYKCSYCSYTNKKARLREHIRIHTGEKPHHCHLCSFTSAYGRNISRHHRRCHNLPLTVGGEPTPPSKQKRSLPHGRRLIVRFKPPKKRAKKSNDLSSELHHPLNNDEYKDMAKESLDSSLDDTPPVSPDGAFKDEKTPIVTQHQVLGSPLAVSTPPPTSGDSCSPEHRKYSPSGAGLLGCEHSEQTSHISHSQPGTPAQDQPLQPQICLHCDIHYTDNILYTIHMCCHGYEHPFQCNVCGHPCRDKYDFACHFAHGRHTK